MTMPKVKSVFLDFIRHVVNGEIDEVSRRLAANPSFATAPSDVGATRQDASTFFFSEIAHYLYAGDTALHMAAAAFRRPVAELLIAHGADCRAKNRRGAEPLHYAADANHWDPTAQAMHGISREVLLRYGRDATEVARDLNERLNGAVLYSDGWGYDFAWLAKLYDEAGLLPRFRIESLRSLLNDAEAARWHATKDSVAADAHSSRHRASTDALVLQRTLLRVKGIPGSDPGARAT